MKTTMTTPTTIRQHPGRTAPAWVAAMQPEPKPGDVVQVNGGKWDGCVLTLEAIVCGEYVCKRTTAPYSVRVNSVRVMRAGTY